MGEGSTFQPFVSLVVQPSVAILRRALTMATATELPPLGPEVIIQGTEVNLVRASLDSTVETKPTGTPMIKLG